MAVKPGHRASLEFATVTWLIVLLLAGLWPLDFRPNNGVHWLEPGPGLAFGIHGIAYSLEALPWQPGRQDLSIELWLEPGEEPHGRLAHVLTFHDGHEVAPLLIAQWRSALILRDRRFRSENSMGYRELGVRGVLPQGQRRFVVVTSNPRGVEVFIDGQAVNAMHSRKPLITDGESLESQLVLGSAPAGTGSWRGHLFGIAIWSRVLSQSEIAQHATRIQRSGFRTLQHEPGLLALYPFDEGGGRILANAAGSAGRLQVPERFEVLLHRRLQVPRAGDLRHKVFGRDLMRNILGFVPLGWLGMLWIRRRRWRRAILAVSAVTLFGAGLSLAIELIQVYLPGRVSSFTDLMSNTLGSLLGALLLLAWPRLSRHLGSHAP